jgi:hypothetical protein
MAHLISPSGDRRAGARFAASGAVRPLVRSGSEAIDPDQRDFFGFDDFAADPPAVVLLAVAFFFTAVVFGAAAVAFGAAAFAFGAAALVFAFAFTDEALAFGRDDDPLDFDPEGERVSFTAWITFAPALVTASAPSATVSPIDWMTPPASRFADFAVRFTDFAAAPIALATGLAVRPSVPLLLFLTRLMGDLLDRDSVPNDSNFVIRLEPADVLPPRLRPEPRFHSIISNSHAGSSRRGAAPSRARDAWASHALRPRIAVLEIIDVGSLVQE